MLTVHDESNVAAAALAAGVDRVVLKRSLATDPLSSVNAMRAGKQLLVA